MAEDAQQVQGWTDQKSNYYISTGTASDGVDTVDIVCIVTDTIGTEIDGTSNDQGVQLKRRFHYTFWLETIIDWQREKIDNATRSLEKNPIW